MTTDAPRRSDTTKAAIITAAREKFAADGYERATIRSIAAAANIDPSMVMRYFGNKEKLFAAAAEFDLMLPDPTDIPRERLGVVLVRHFVDRWTGNDTMLALLRAAVSHEAAAEQIQHVYMTQVGPLVAKVAPDHPERRAGLMATQLIGFIVCCYVLRLPPVVAKTADEVVSDLAPTIQRYLTGELA